MLKSVSRSAQTARRIRATFRGLVIALLLTGLVLTTIVAVLQQFSDRPLATLLDRPSDEIELRSATKSPITNDSPITPTESPTSTAESPITTTESPTTSTDPLPPCQHDHKGLLNEIEHFFNYTERLCEADIELLYPDLQMGGKYRPSTCLSVHRVAIIVAYRNRVLQLRNFLYYMHRLLQHQQLQYGIYIIDQISDQTFNRGKLFNVGAQWASSEGEDWQCFVFHDVDLLPENEHQIYSCPNDDKHARHMSNAIRHNNYRLFYGTAFGGISVIKRNHFEKVNGYSNCYWGWGKEDDDMYQRLKINKVRIQRRNAETSKSVMMSHLKNGDNPINICNTHLLSLVKRRWKTDGLNSLEYSVKRTVKTRLYTRVIVDLLEDDSKSKLKKVRMRNNTCFV